MWKLVTLVTKVCWHMKWCKTPDKKRKIKFAKFIESSKMDSNSQFTIYGGMRGITIKTNVKTCYTLD